MTSNTQYEEKARDIMDEACLPEMLHQNGAYSACVSAIASALEEARSEGYKAGRESEAAMWELSRINQELGIE